MVSNIGWRLSEPTKIQGFGVRKRHYHRGGALGNALVIHVNRAISGTGHKLTGMGRKRRVGRPRKPRKARQSTVIIPEIAIGTGRRRVHRRKPRVTLSGLGHRRRTTHRRRLVLI